MFVILYYDVDSKRCQKMLKICRKYLTWVQNSVFEGEISEANYERMVSELQEKMGKNTDSLVVYQFRTMKYSKRLVYGSDKKENFTFL